MIIDSHCHLDSPKLYDQLDIVVKRAEDNDVKCLLTICTTLESFEKIKLITKKYQNIYGTFGIHPHESKNYLNVNAKYMYVVTTRDIKSGDEITANYNLYTYPKTGIGLQMI